LCTSMHSQSFGLGDWGSRVRISALRPDTRRKARQAASTSSSGAFRNTPIQALTRTPFAAGFVGREALTFSRWPWADGTGSAGARHTFVKRGPVQMERTRCRDDYPWKGSTYMADDPAKRGPADRSRISLLEPHEVQYWADKFGVSKERLSEAVMKVGHSVDAVSRELTELRRG